MISVISRHLPLAFQFLKEPHLTKSFELLHLVESARYHQTNLLSLQIGMRKSPDGFDPGVMFTDDQRDKYWRMMASVIEFESFLFSCKRFLDGGWLFFRAQLNGILNKKVLSDADTLGKAMKHFNSNQDLQSYPYIKNLIDYWNRWGKDLTDLRNYIEHESPLGGTGFGYTILNTDNATHYMVLPEVILKNGKRIPKEQLSYHSQKLASDYVTEHIEMIDFAIIQLIQSFHQPKLTFLGDGP